jgi:hypothetical protein
VRRGTAVVAVGASVASALGTVGGVVAGSTDVASAAVGHQECVYGGNHSVTVWAQEGDNFWAGAGMLHHAPGNCSTSGSVGAQENGGPQTWAMRIRPVVWAHAPGSSAFVCDDSQPAQTQYQNLGNGLAWYHNDCGNGVSGKEYCVDAEYSHWGLWSGTESYYINSGWKTY